MANCKGERVLKALYKFNKELYSKEDLIKTAYRFIDDFYIHLDADENYYYVNIQAKKIKHFMKKNSLMKCLFNKQEILFIKKQKILEK